MHQDTRIQNVLPEELLVVLQAQNLFRSRLRALLMQRISGEAFGAGLNSALIDLLDAMRDSRQRLEELGS